MPAKGTKKKRKYTRRKAKGIEAVIQTAQGSFSKGNDKAARLMIATGAFVVVTDITYRLAKTSLEIKTPGVMDILGRLMDPAGALSEMGASIITGNLTSLWQEIIPQIKVDVPEDGMWDFKFTAMGFGLLVSGIGLYVACHPELISKAMDTAKTQQQNRLDFFQTMLTNTKMEGKELVKLAGDVAPLAAGL